MTREEYIVEIAEKIEGMKEKNIYKLISTCYIAQFYPLHIFDQIKLSLKFAGENFQATGRTERQLGWKSLYMSEKHPSENEEDDTKKGFERIEKMIGSSDEDSQAAAARTVDDMKKVSRYPSEGRPESKDPEEIMDILNELHEMFEEEVADD